MLEIGDSAPAFTAPLATDEVTTFSLTPALDTEAPIVLAFFPGAFTSVCSHEMATFEDRLDELTDAGGTLYGVSVDLPFALSEFHTQQSLSFGLLSDTNRTLVEAYDVAIDFDHLGIEGLANRAVYVIDSAGTITYAWAGENPGIEPDYDEVIAAVAETA